jgi:GR25 family glycosyltransferase involved in LPS biosynthesis
MRSQAIALLVISLVATTAIVITFAMLTSYKKQFLYQTYVINMDKNPERYEYVVAQLKKQSIHPIRFPAVNGKEVSISTMVDLGVTPGLTVSRPHAGCASSHLKLWRMLADNNSDWVLVLEDDVNFHPQFSKVFSAYWKKVPKDAMIVYLGYCCGWFDHTTSSPVIPLLTACLHAYMINGHGARTLLNNILPVDKPIDLAVMDYFRNHPGSYVFNGYIPMNNIRPMDYAKDKENECMFEGIVFQNRKQHKSTIDS